METYKPDQPSGITIEDVVSEFDGKPHRVTIINFGIQDAQRGRHFARELARYDFDPVQAEAEIWREAWQLYPKSRAFACWFVQEAKREYAECIRYRFSE